MKKITLFTALLTLSLISHAQLSLFSGLSLSEFWHDHDRDIMYKAGFDGGVSDRIWLGKRISLEPSVRYHSKGTLINHDTDGDHFRMNLAYTETQVVVNFHIGKVVAIHAGGFAGYLVRMNINKWDQAEVRRFDFSTDKEDINRVDYGPAAGISFDLHGAIFSIEGMYGVKVIGKQDKPLGRWYGNDGNGKRLHPGFMNRSISGVLKVPFRLHKYK